MGQAAYVYQRIQLSISGQDTIVGINQGWKLSGAIKTAERKLADKTLVHRGQRLMAWAVSNARVEPKGNAIVYQTGFRHCQDRPADGRIQCGCLVSANPASSQPSIFVI